MQQSEETLFDEVTLLPKTFDHKKEKEKHCYKYIICYLLRMGKAIGMANSSFN